MYNVATRVARWVCALCVACLSSLVTRASRVGVPVFCLTTLYPGRGVGGRCCVVVCCEVSFRFGGVSLCSFVSFRLSILRQKSGRTRRANRRRTVRKRCGGGAVSSRKQVSEGLWKVCRGVRIEPARVAVCLTVQSVPRVRDVFLKTRHAASTRDLGPPPGLLPDPRDPPGSHPGSSGPHGGFP